MIFSIVVYRQRNKIAKEKKRSDQLLVDSYKCEWKEVGETPELSKRFNHFVNAPEEKDPTIAFEGMREQMKVKEWKPPFPKGV